MRHHRLATLLAAALAVSALGLTPSDPRLIDVRMDEPRMPSEPGYRPHEVIVQFDDAASYSDAMHAIHDAGGLAARRSRDPNRVLVTLERNVPVAGAVERLSKMRGVRFAEPNGRVRAFGRADSRFSPNDRFFFRQWHMKMLDAERMWAIQKGDASVVVAVLDTGIAYEDFGPYRRAPDWGSTVFVPGFNVLTGDAHANDDNGHGTHVASTIAEGTNNGEGVAGLAFNCALMPVKVLDRDGDGSVFDVAEGILFAIRDAPRKANVINLSLGGDSERTLGDAIDQAVRANVVVVAAAGNDNEGTVSFPASHPRVIGVGAVDARQQRAAYSNYGTALDVVAPGGDVDRDDDDDGFGDGVLQQTFDRRTARLGRYDDFAYFFIDGTSQAAPHVAATAALLIRQGITSPVAVQAAIQNSALDLGPSGRDDEYGHGLVQPVEALTGLGLNE